MSNWPEIDPASALLFVINGASGHHDANAVGATIEAGLQAAGRTGEMLFAQPDELPQLSRRAAATAKARRSAVVAVGGDGSINAVAQAAHAETCPMGVLPMGTFNYFARTHGIPTEAGPALHAVLNSAPRPVQVGAVNDRLFLVNASLGLYPDLLDDREAYKARFGRSRWVALASVGATLLRERRQLRLRIERDGALRDVRTPTLFIGNNRLQLEQVGVHLTSAMQAGRITAVMLRPIGSLALLWLLLRGAFGSLGEADDVESFEFERMVVMPRLARGRRLMKVAFDGEVSWMRAPLAFSVSPRPLYLLKPPPDAAAGGPQSVA